jgi:lysophospholipase L1-like esterase
MSNYNRRTFIKTFPAIGGLAFLTQSCVNNSNNSNNNQTNVPPKTTESPAVTKKFQMLTIGDSVMWGQGLEEKDKFRTLVKVWLEEKLGQPDCVNLVNLAHSGATIKEPKKKEKDYQIKNPNEDFKGEIPTSYPIITQQLETSLTHFTDPKEAKLILVDGGANDMSKLTALLLPNSANKLITEIEAIKLFGHQINFADYEKKIGTAMGELLTQVADKYKYARIIVTGYYPIITEGTSPDELFNIISNLFEENSLPDKLLTTIIKPIKNNPLKKHRYYKAVVENSKTWADESNKHLEAQVKKLNETNKLTDSNRAFFAKVNFDDHGYNAEDTFLWKLEGKAKTDDKLRDARKTICSPTNDHKFAPDFDYQECKRAGVFHPNEKGAAEYSKAIIELLDTNWDKLGWKI